MKKYFYCFLIGIFMFRCEFHPQKIKAVDKSPNLRLTVRNLAPDELKAFRNLKCQPAEGQDFKYLTIKNDLYDTLFVPVSDYCKINAPFLLYDKLEYYRSDSTFYSDLIFTASGYDLILSLHDSASVLLRVKDKRLKSVYSFSAMVDSSGEKSIKDFKFRD